MIEGGVDGHLLTRQTQRLLQFTPVNRETLSIRHALSLTLGVRTFLTISPPIAILFFFLHLQ